MFFQMKLSKFANQDRGNERIIRNRRETCTPCIKRREQKTERERKKKRKKECFPRDWDISREESRGGRRRRKKKRHSPLVMLRRTRSFSQEAKEASRASVIFLLVPGVNGGTCAGISETRRYIPQLFIKSLNLTSIYSSRAKRFRFVIKKIVQFFR